MLLPFQVLLSPPIIVYSPRVLPVYIYDAHADSAKNVRYKYIPILLCLFLVLRIDHDAFISVLSHPKSSILC
jgi:hypothetical protein